jgi:hypothetical protein
MSATFPSRLSSNNCKSLQLSHILQPFQFFFEEEKAFIRCCIKSRSQIPASASNLALTIFSAVKLVTPKHDIEAGISNIWIYLIQGDFGPS